MKEARQRYTGPVEIWVDGVKRCDVEASLTGWVKVITIRTTGGESTMDGTTSWDGQFIGLPKATQYELAGKELELRFPHGTVGRAVLRNTRGSVQGVRETPFN